VYLIDTDHLGILQLRDGEEFTRLRQRLNAHSADAFLVSIITFHEQVNGWQAYLQQRTNEQIVRAYRQFELILMDFNGWSIAPFDAQAAEEFVTLRRQRVRIGTMDLRIASIALVGDHTVLTRNVVDFGQVPGLKVEDWTVAPADPR
jgi:tRNA(fMet)-specific endonuclease VapC